MGGLKECLEAYGADYTATMERFMGNEALYRKIFDMFFRMKTWGDWERH